MHPTDTQYKQPPLPGFKELGDDNWVMTNNPATKIFEDTKLIRQILQKNLHLR